MGDLKDRYDLVIIGAGMGGLTCGGLLAKEGLSVLVIEQHVKPGGYCTSFERKGFAFDLGFDFLTGCEEGGTIAKTINELRLGHEIEFIKLNSVGRLIGRDHDIRVMSLKGAGEELKRRFPAESKSIDAFVPECKALNAEIGPLLQAVPDLMSFRQKIEFVMKFLVKCPRFRKYGMKPSGKVASSFFKDPKLNVILLTPIIDFAPGMTAVMLLECLAESDRAYYPKRGGVQALANLFAKGLTNHGGELALKTSVNKIIINNGKATGVELADGHRIKSNYVVSNADARQTFLNLVGQEYLMPKFVRELNESRLTPSAFLVSLGVDMDLGAMGFDGALISYCPNYDLNKLFGSDPENCRIGIKMHSLLDPTQAPAGMHTVQLVAALPHDYMDYWRREKDGTRGKQYKELKESVANKLIASVENIIPGLSEHIVYRDIATPLTFERFTSNSCGAMAGWYPAPTAKIRSQRTPIKNLFQAGHWTFPGGTVAFAIQSGRNAAQMVLGDSTSSMKTN